MRNRVLLTTVSLLLWISSLAHSQTSDKGTDDGRVRFQQELDASEAENFIAFNATRAAVIVSTNRNYDRDYSETLTKTLIAKLKLAGVAVLDYQGAGTYGSNLITFVIQVDDFPPGKDKYVNVDCQVSRSVRLLESMRTVIRASLWTKRDWKVTDRPREFINTSFDQVLTKLILNIYIGKTIETTPFLQ